MPVYIPNLETAVEAPDSAANVTPGDVIGNKTDTAAGTSLVSRALQTQDLHDVPATDSLANVTIRDVIGSKLDRAENNGDSIFAFVHIINEHFHSSQIVKPNLANTVLITAAVGAWTYGALSADLIAAASMAAPYDIHGIAIDTISANDQYQLALVKTVGGVDTEVGVVSFVRTSPLISSLHVPMQTPLIEATARLRAKLACAGGSNTIGLKVRVHTYL